MDKYNSCTKKVLYTSRKLAKLDARKIKSAKGLVLRPYRCIYCDNFHLTSYDGKQRRKAKEWLCRQLNTVGGEI